MFSINLDTGLFYLTGATYLQTSFFTFNYTLFSKGSRFRLLGLPQTIFFLHVSVAVIKNERLISSHMSKSVLDRCVSLEVTQ